MKKIIDTFHDAPISRQRKYQLRKRAQGKCEECGRASKWFVRCPECSMALHQQRECKRYNSTSPSIKALQARRAKRAAAKKRGPRNPWLIKEKNG